MGGYHLAFVSLSATPHSVSLFPVSGSDPWLNPYLFQTLSPPTCYVNFWIFATQTTGIPPVFRSPAWQMFYFLSPWGALNILTALKLPNTPRAQKHLNDL